MTVSVADFPAPVGAVVRIERDGERHVRRRSRRLSRRSRARVFAEPHGRRATRKSRSLLRTARSLKIGPGLLGRVIDAHGRCIDGRPQPVLPSRARLDRLPPLPTERPRIRAPLATGVSCDRCAADLRPRSAAGNFFRLRRRQERAAGHDVPLHECRRDRHRPSRRARPRSQRVPGARPRRRGSSAQRRRRGDEQRAGAESRARGFDRDGRGRVFSRSRQASAAA